MQHRLHIGDILSEDILAGHHGGLHCFGVMHTYVSCESTLMLVHLSTLHMEQNSCVEVQCLGCHMHVGAAV